MAFLSGGRHRENYSPPRNNVTSRENNATCLACCVTLFCRFPQDRAGNQKTLGRRNEISFIPHSVHSVRAALPRRNTCAEIKSLENQQRFYRQTPDEYYTARVERKVASGQEGINSRNYHDHNRFNARTSCKKSGGIRAYKLATLFNTALGI